MSINVDNYTEEERRELRQCVDTVTARADECIRRETAPDLTGAYAWAEYSTQEHYRYVLGRVWGPRLPRIVWVMLNPSTATEEVLDPTITRCMTRSRAAGYGSLVVVNLFAWRETSPAVMKQRHAPVGPCNDEVILRECRVASCVVAAWGKDGGHLGRAAAVTRMLQADGISLMCLQRNYDGSPMHPLYVPMSKGFEPFSVTA